jgi:hypothetical protein
MSEDEGLMAQASVESEDNQQPEQGTISHLEPDNQPSVEDVTVAAEGEDIEFTREDWFPEKFWNDESGPDIENLAKSYSELQKKFSQGKHKAPENYDTKLFNDANIEEDDPLLSTYSDWAKENGISQAAFEELGAKFVEMAGQAEAEEQLSYDEEYKALGPNADLTLKSMTEWAQGLVRKGVWGDDDFEEFKIMGGTAQGIKALQKVRNYYGDQTVPVNVGEPEGAPSKEELQAMVADPRYVSDPSFRIKVERLFEQTYGNSDYNPV